MLLVTQGHEKSISTEVFIKSYLLLSNLEREKIVFYGNKEFFLENCRLLNIKASELDNENLMVENCNLKFKHFPKNDNTTMTTLALEGAISDMSAKDILVTMPSSKDQITYKDQACSGHTDYFRKRYMNSNISMMFKNKWENVLLLSDHIPLIKVPEDVKLNSVIDKVKLTVSEFENHFKPLKKIVFAGINPHAGEDGLIGSEDEEIKLAVERLKHDYPNQEIIGPLAGDSLHLYKSPDILKVFSFHDQGLVYFKSMYNFIGANITLGLPYLRVSVDHGTAFELYGKNLANYMGCYNLFKDCLSWK